MVLGGWITKDFKANAFSKTTSDHESAPFACMRMGAGGISTKDNRPNTWNVNILETNKSKITRIIPGNLGWLASTLWLCVAIKHYIIGSMVAVEQ